MPEITAYKYDRGTNIQITADNGKSVSVCRTDGELWDVETENGSHPYTGFDPVQAGEAARNALEKEK